MWISYSDSEVNKFHPVCEQALNLALQKLGLNTSYRVLHHQYTGSLEMDFVIQNVSTGKYLCVIEVKRTPTDVHSARYQFQAMSYVQMNASETERPFYILTNLEYAFLFRYDGTLPRVFQQMLQPGLTSIGNFQLDNEEIFIEKLSEFFKITLDKFRNNQFEYLVTLELFAEHMERIKTRPRQWKSSLAILLYEYIRGAFTFVNRNELHDIRIFNNDVLQICNEAAQVNFKEIFNYSDDAFESRMVINNNILVDLFDFGNKNVSGDSVAGILHEIASSGHEHEGEVPTDLELGRVLAVLAHYINGDIDDGYYICDPAAGSGNLISSAINIFGLNARQIKANDWNPQLLELLSLRLGLNYIRTICSENSPFISAENVANLDVEYFNNVQVVVMNPPFVAGINCVDRKQEFYKRINQLAGTDTGTNVGQMPLEAVFLELITFLVAPGTTIACILPKTHLLARGTEAKVLRRLILENLGLRVVFTYPGLGLFEDVSKDTCVIVGKAMQPSDNIEIISSYDKITDLDIHRFVQSLEESFGDIFSSIMPGVMAKSVTIEELRLTIDDGWRGLNSELVEAIDFVRNNFEISPYFNQLLYEDGWLIKRGPAGNSGGSDIIFIDTRSDLYEVFEDRGLVLKSGMRNAKMNNFLINEGDSKYLDIASNNEDIITEILETYNSLPARGGRQQRQVKTVQEWRNILHRESRGGFRGNSVLIPRGIRRIGRIYLSNNDVFVSTNFVVITLPSCKDAILLSTWMSTIFYQLISEVSSKDQEGMRKMEKEDILKTFIPYFDNIPEEVVDDIETEISSMEFLDLQNPVIRNIDIIWANAIFGDEGNEILTQAQRLLKFLANKRNPTTIH